MLIIALLCSSSNKEAAYVGEHLLKGVLLGIAVLVVGFVLFVGFEFAPAFTKWTLIAAAVAAVALLIRWIYKRFCPRQPK